MVELTLDEIKERLNNMILPRADHVVGIGTGGSEPARLVAQKLRCPYSVMTIEYRDENNRPKHHEPKLVGNIDIDLKDKTVLLVDDVSVSGKTLAAARALLGEGHVSTCVFKGKADYVLFPEIEECVNWPWKAKEVSHGKLIV